MAALNYGNSVRIMMADEKRRINAAGPLRLLDLLAAPPQHVARMKVGQLLDALPRVGPERALRFLRLANIGPHRYESRLEALTADERDRLASTLIHELDRRERR